MQQKLFKVFQRTYKAKRSLVPFDDSFYQKNYVKRDHEMYESLYLYTEDHVEHLKEKGTLSGIKDNFTDRVVWDFDNEENPQLALDDAQALVNNLLSYDIPKHAIRCFFSGNKGYHIEVHVDDYIDRDAFTSIVEHFAQGLEFFDTSVKDEQRVFRFPLSINPKTKLYKLPILVNDFTQLSHDEIKSWAKKPDWENAYGVIGQFASIPMPTIFADLIAGSGEPDLVEYEGENAEDTGPDMQHRPRFLTPAKYVLSLGYFEEGERNRACMILAATYKYLDFTKEQAYGMIKIALRKRAERLGIEYSEDSKKQLWNEVIEVVYGPYWQGATYSEHTEPLLIKTIEEYDLGKYYNSNTSSTVVTIDDVAQNFVNFANNIDNNLIKTGIEEIDKDIILTSSMLVGFLGAPSSGKTTAALLIAENQVKNNISTFFVSADMGDKLFFARCMQKYCGLSFQHIVEEMKNKPYAMWSKNVRDAFDKAKETFANIGLAFNSGPTIESIRLAVDEHEQATGRPVKCLFVDYLEKMRCDYSDANAASAYNASRLADFTRDKDLTTFLMLQTQKQGGDPSDELTSMRRVKGSSVIEQDCRVIFSTWRPGFNPDVKGRNPDDKFACIAVVKNNMGVTGRYDFGFDGARGLYTSLGDEALQELEEVKQRAAQRKAMKANGTYGTQGTGQHRDRKPFNPNGKKDLFSKMNEGR